LLMSGAAVMKHRERNLERVLSLATQGRYPVLGPGKWLPGFKLNRFMNTGHREAPELDCGLPTRG
jgi:hypothetical protein